VYGFRSLWPLTVSVNRSPASRKEGRTVAWSEPLRPVHSSSHATLLMRNVFFLKECMEQLAPTCDIPGASKPACTSHAHWSWRLVVSDLRATFRSRGACQWHRRYWRRYWRRELLHSYGHKIDPLLGGWRRETCYTLLRKSHLAK
jgi:hypothetical protein